jgi:hypothetical protein
MAVGRTHVWHTQQWRDQAVAWATSRLADLGLRVTGPPEQPHVRPWSTLLRIPTSDGPVWLKANGPGTAYEARILQASQHWAVPQLPIPLAVDADRAWSLLADAGSPLRSELAASRNLKQWLAILPEYAQVQMALTPRADEMLALGVPDLRPRTVPAHFTRLLSEHVWLRLGASDGITRDDLHRLRRLAPQISQWSEQLEASGINPTLQHDDFHDGNVFVRHSSKKVAYVFLDWGDASVAHPFGTLLANLRNVATRMDTPADHTLLRTLRDAYLEPWTAQYDRSDLLDAVRWATRLAKVGRAVAWRRALTGANGSERAAYAEFVTGWLRDLLANDSW